MPVILLRLFVYPVDTAKFPTIPPGFVWVLMVGDVPPEFPDRAANAHWAATREAAEQEGDKALASAVRVLQMVGQPGRYGGVTHIDYDPIPAGHDRVNFV